MGSKVVGGGNPSSTGDRGEVFPTDIWLVSIDTIPSDVPEDCWRETRGGRILRIADCIENIEGRSTGSILQHDCMSSHIFGLSPTAVDSGYSGIAPLHNKTGTNNSGLEL